MFIFIGETGANTVLVKHTVELDVLVSNSLPHNFIFSLYRLYYNIAGVFNHYYGGEAESHIVQYSARLYFVCLPGTKLQGPLLEHLKDSYTAHIRFNTQYVC